jgi:hypothetical protein
MLPVKSIPIYDYNALPKIQLLFKIKIIVFLTARRGILGFLISLNRTARDAK